MECPPPSTSVTGRLRHPGDELGNGEPRLNVAADGVEQEQYAVDVLGLLQPCEQRQDMLIFCRFRALRRGAVALDLADDGETVDRAAAIAHNGRAHVDQQLLRRVGGLLLRTGVCGFRLLVHRRPPVCVWLSMCGLCGDYSISGGYVSFFGERLESVIACTTRPGVPCKGPKMRDRLCVCAADGAKFPVHALCDLTAPMCPAAFDRTAPSNLRRGRCLHRPAIDRRTSSNLCRGRRPRRSERKEHGLLYFIM